VGVENLSDGGQYRREGIELTSGFTATVNADLKSASSER